MLCHGVLTGSSPVLTTEGANPETLKEKVGDSWKDSSNAPFSCGYEDFLYKLRPPVPMWVKKVQDVKPPD